MIVKGLGRIDGSNSRDQEGLRARVARVLGAIGSVPVAVLKVVVYPPHSAPVYDCELSSAEAVSALVRDFYKFTRRRDPVRRPVELEGVSVYHSVTPGTRVRISLLRVSV